MIFSLFLLLPKITKSDDSCVEWNSSCEQCLGLGKDTNCGWCKDSLQCLLANDDGTAPLNGSCVEWTFTFDMTCHLESQEPLPLGTRIGLAIFAGIVAIVTAAFWICIFPHFLQQKPKQEQLQEQEEEDE